MRELKFRAWDGGTVIYDVVPTCEEEIAVLSEYDWTTRSVIVEQYTGLKDKNGKEIYEGDIVEALIDGAWETGRNTVGFGKVKWRLEVLYNDIRFMDVLHVIGSKNRPDRIYYLFDKELSGIKVIGNIHENPELLEDEKCGN